MVLTPPPTWCRPRPLPLQASLTGCFTHSDTWWPFWVGDGWGVALEECAVTLVPLPLGTGEQEVKAEGGIRGNTEKDV